MLAFFKMDVLELRKRVSLDSVADTFVINFYHVSCERENTIVPKTCQIVDG